MGTKLMGAERHQIAEEFAEGGRAVEMMTTGSEAVAMATLLFKTRLHDMIILI
jgi:hypothetical protein